MFNINQFLEKFIKLQKGNELRNVLILETIKEITNIDVKKEEIEIKGDNLYIKVNPVYKSEIFMNREKLEDSLKSKNIFLRIH